MSGIKAHTLRVWESRYAILQPKRTSTNIRYYNEDDLKLLLNISLLNCNGYKISRIAKMSSDEIHDCVRSLSEDSGKYENQISALTLAMIELDESRFEKVISVNTLRYGFEATMLNIIYPFFSKIGILWQTGSINPAQEHFISNLIRQKMIVAIDGQVTPRNENARKFILFLPEGEYHEISLLFSSYILKSRQNHVYYLGQSLPGIDLGTVYDIYLPEYLVTHLTTKPSKTDIKTYLKNLSERFPKSTILISGQIMEGLSQVNLPANIRHLKQVDQLIRIAEGDLD